MKRLIRVIKNKYEYIFAISFAVAFFIFLYGVKTLDVTCSDYLFSDYEIKLGAISGMDDAQNYLGLKAYRYSDWKYPFGCYDRLSYPYNNSIIFTDSLPAMAVLCKIFSPFLPLEFHYFGIWELLCFILQAIFAIRIIKNYTNNKIYLALSSILFITAPIFIWRVNLHIALSSHWIILMALEKLFSKKKKSFKKDVIFFCLISILASSVHMYLYLFVGIITFGYSIYYYLDRKKILNSFVIIADYIVGGMITVYLLGGFSVDNSGEAAGLFSCTFNLNSFFDSYGYSIFMPELSHYIGEDFFKSMQYEGYAYLGLGVFTLVIFVAIGLMFNKQKINMNQFNRVVCLLIVSVIAFLLALSPVVTFGNNVLVSYTLPDVIIKFWSVFRSTGRNIWIVVYIIMIVLAIELAKIYDGKWSVFIMSFIVILQLCDSSVLYSKIRNYYLSDLNNRYTYNEVLQDKEFWESVIDNDNIKHIVLGVTAYPYDDESWYSVENYFHVGIHPQQLQTIEYVMADFALKNNYTLNYFRFSRFNYNNAREFVLSQISDKSSGRDKLYIFWEANKFQAFSTGYNVYYADGLYIAYNGELNSNYLLSENAFSDIIDFSGEKDGAYYLPAGKATLINCLELANGNYLLEISADFPENIKPEIKSALTGELYECVLEKRSKKECVYSFNVRKSDSTVCIILYNESNTGVYINRLKLEALL